ncbi:hypothetical protein A2115_00740 [Candidatus Woesebacteria bacterium GWA1_41_8]|uniref:CMP/dCMP-type deaminase domain-containing protein n=1 Tax=Candidatus Woesebacteria bacterium GWA1_41_8 TaxID=1802471 RepID=A0A1F7WI85_9BACT|nr:MAG: hypothetical protein A2115_00740 [Candidatus Woesebacteria bacterium GWA1_41_8]
MAEAESIGLETLQELAKKASEASKLSYSPQSHYPVGAAILRTSGQSSDGQNIEIATYSETGHAEEQSIKNAVSSGAVRDEGRTFLRAIAVSHKEDTAPCGRCRQIIAEFSDNALVVVADINGKIRSITSSRILLPYAFTLSDLENAQSK